MKEAHCEDHTDCPWRGKEECDNGCPLYPPTRGGMMKEEDYVKATNRVKVSTALTIMRDVLPGDDGGISDREHSEIVSVLSKLETKLFKSFLLEG